MIQLQQEESKQQNMYVNPYMEQEQLQDQNSRFFTPKKDEASSSKFGSKINLLSNQSKS